MIEIKTIGVWGFEGAIRGMRMPYESFDKSDSRRVMTVEQNELGLFKGFEFQIGEADMALCKKLISSGSEHRKFLRMIHVQAEVRAPRYWLTELDTYKIGTVRNSSSTMHLITKRLLTTDDFSNDCDRHAMQCMIAEINELIDVHNDPDTPNDMRNEYFAEIKQLLPESFMQRIMWDANYECLFSIYHQRKNHRLTEWREFCKWIEGLPYMEDFINA